MKILYIITKSNWGGAQKYVHDVALAMREKGHEVVVAAGGNGPMLQKLEHAGMRTIHLDKSQRDVNITKDLATFRELYRLVKKENPDVLHLNSAKVSGLGALAGQLLGVKKIVFTLHGLAFNESRSWFGKLLIKKFTWLTILLSHTTIAVSHGIAHQIDYFPFIKNKIKVIHNGLVQKPLLSREPACLFLTKNPNKFIIATIAELHHIKGLKYALEAMKILREKVGDVFEYVIMGEGDERENLENMIAEYGLKNVVTLKGHTTDAFQYLSGADAFLLPSLSEGLAYVVLEAGMAKLPVIASNVGGLPEVIRDTETGLLVPAKNAPAIAEALEKIYSDKALAERLARNLHELVARDFSEEKMARETEGVYLDQ